MRCPVMMASVVGGIEYGVLRVEGKPGPLILDTGNRSRHPPHLDCRPRLFLNRKPVPDMQVIDIGKVQIMQSRLHQLASALFLSCVINTLGHGALRGFEQPQLIFRL